MSTIIASIHPKHSQAILDGRKTVELRRVLPKRPVDRMLIYETAPTSLVVGSVDVVKKVGCDDSNPAWASESDNFWLGCSHLVGDVSFLEFLDYFDRVMPRGLLLGNPTRQPCGPIEFFGLSRPPQSWCYLPEGVGL